MGKKQTIKHMPEQTSTHLRDTRAGREHMIWGWTPELAVLPHMAPYNLPAKEAEPEDGPKNEKPKEESQESRVPAVVAAIAVLGEGDFTKTGANPGAPKIDALTKLLGWKDNAVTTAERDEAWTLYQEKQDAGQPDTGDA